MRTADPGLEAALLLRNLLAGAAVTLALTFTACGCGSGLAVVLTLALMAGRLWLRRLGRVYVNAMRGTPLLVLLFLVHVGLPASCQQLGHPLHLHPVLAAVGALSLKLAACDHPAHRTRIDRARPMAASGPQARDPPPGSCKASSAVVPGGGTCSCAGWTAEPGGNHLWAPSGSAWANQRKTGMTWPEPAPSRSIVAESP